MININTTGVILGSISFGLILFLWFLYEEKISKRNVTELDKRLNKFDEEQEKKEDFETKKKDFFTRMEETLEDAEIKLNVWVFFFIFLIASIVLYLVTLSIFTQPLVAFAPLPFTLYLLPRLIIDTKKKKAMDKFDSELITVLRRMASVLQSGSVLQAIEEARELKNISTKMKKLLATVHHNIKFGDSIEDAFYKASKDIKSESLEIAIVSIDLNKELGADLSGSLNDIAMRIQKNQITDREAQSLIAQTVVIGNVLSVMPFLILGYMAYSNPTYFSDYLLSITNQITFMGMIFLMFVGIFIIQKGAQQKIR